MTVRVQYLEVHEVAKRCGIDIHFIEEMAQIELIHLESGAGGEQVISAEDAERVRVGVVLVNELDVNLEGVEVILHMRESMLSMQRQFAELLAGVARDVKSRTS